MIPTLRDRPAAPRHEGLLAASAGHRQTAMRTWARSALDRSEKLLTLCAPLDADIASRAGSGIAALTAEDLHTTTPPAEVLQRALHDVGHGLRLLVWADAVIAATSRETHAEIETTLASLDGPVSVLCVYDRDGARDGAGIEHLDLAVARHPDGLREQRLALRRTADTLYVDGEIDMSNLDVFATALRALTDGASPTARIDLAGVTFLAAAAARTSSATPLPTATAERTSKSTPRPTSPASSNCSTSTDSPNSTSVAEGCAQTRGNDRSIVPHAEEAASAKLDNQRPSRLPSAAAGPMATCPSAVDLVVPRTVVPRTLRVMRQ